MENGDTFCAIKIFVFFSCEFTKMQLIFLTESWIISRIPYREFANSRVSSLAVTVKNLVHPFL